MPLNYEEEDDGEKGERRLEYGDNKRRIFLKSYDYYSAKSSGKARSVIENADDSKSNYFLDEGDEYEEEVDEDYEEEEEEVTDNSEEDSKNNELDEEEPDDLETYSTNMKILSKSVKKYAEQMLVEAEEEEGDGSLSSKASSLTNDRLRIDPNYKWLLKDLNLNNNRRVIDVTEIIEYTETKNANEDNAEKHEESEEKSHENVESEDEYKNDHNHISKLYQRIVNESELGDGRGNDVNNKTTDESIVEQAIESDDDDDDDDGDDDDDDVDDSEPEDNNNNINNDNDETEEDKIHLPSSDAYKEWSKKHRSKEYLNDAKEIDKDEENAVKHFSKSFEVSIEDLDKMINRVDNGIKLKRTKEYEEESIDDKSDIKIVDSKRETKDQVDVVDSLKQEWSMMFTKLEQEYKSKLEEQQKVNETRLKQLHDEIKESIQLQNINQQQQQLAIQQQQQQQQQQSQLTPTKPSVHIDSASKDGISLKSTITLHTKNQTQSVSTNTSPTLSSSSSVNIDQAKHISNVKLELKNKHARHMQDLRDYYEKELDEMRKELSRYKINETGNELVSYENDHHSNAEYHDEQNSRISMSQQLILNSELKNSNNELLQNFVS